jgi:hypothetical protein
MLPNRVLVLLLLAACVLWSAPVRAETPPSLWFEVGEELTYKLHWGVIHVGESRVTTEWVEEDGRRLLAIRYRTRSNAFLDRIYRVDDTVESIIDPATFLPVRFTKILNEGRYRADEVTVFDHAARKAVWTNRRKNETREFEIEPDTRDLVTFMYYMRQIEFKTGERPQYRVMADEKLYDVWLNVGKVETMKLEKYGKVKSIKITPDAAFQGLFVRKGKIDIWVSQDTRRVATRLQATVPVADVHINLYEVRGPGNDAWVQGGSNVTAQVTRRAVPVEEAEHVH